MHLASWSTRACSSKRGKALQGRRERWEGKLERQGCGLHSSLLCKDSSHLLHLASWSTRACSAKRGKALHTRTTIARPFLYRILTPCESRKCQEPELIRHSTQLSAKLRAVSKLFAQQKMPFLTGGGKRGRYCRAPTPCTYTSITLLVIQRPRLLTSSGFSVLAINHVLLQLGLARV